MLYSMRLHKGLEQDGKSKSKDKKAPVGALSQVSDKAKNTPLGVPNGEMIL